MIKCALKRIPTWLAEALEIVLDYIITDKIMIGPGDYYHLPGGHHHQCSHPSVADTLLNSLMMSEMIVLLKDMERALENFEPTTSNH